MSNFVRSNNDQFNPQLYNNKINKAGFKSTCQSLGSNMSGGSSPNAKEAYGVNGISSSDARLFSGSYAPIKTTKLNQCGGKKKRRKTDDKDKKPESE